MLFWYRRKVYVSTSGLYSSAHCYQKGRLTALLVNQSNEALEESSAVAVHAIYSVKENEMIGLSVVYCFGGDSGIGLLVGGLARFLPKGGES